MKKGAFIVLLAFLLSFSVAFVTADIPEGISDSLENILIIPLVEIQAVSAPDFGGLTVLSVSYSEPIEVESITIMESGYIAFEMDTLESYQSVDSITNKKIGRLREVLLIAAFC